MEVTIRMIGNSKGVVLPKPLLAQAGLDDQATAEIKVEEGVIVLSKPRQPARKGWAECAQVVAAQESGKLLMGDFGNAQDTDWQW